MLIFGDVREEPSDLILVYSHPASTSHLTKIVVPPSLRASYLTFADSRSPLENMSTPAIVISTANMACPLTLQLAESVGYVDHIRSPRHCRFNPAEKSEA